MLYAGGHVLRRYTLNCLKWATAIKALNQVQSSAIRPPEILQSTEYRVKRSPLTKVRFPARAIQIWVELCVGSLLWHEDFPDQPVFLPWEKSDTFDLWLGSVVIMNYKLFAACKDDYPPKLLLLLKLLFFDYLLLVDVLHDVYIHALVVNCHRK